MSGLFHVNVARMTNLRTSLLLFSFAVLSLLLGGCARPWTVMSQASPNPMSAQSTFTIEKLTFEGLRVGEKSDAQYAAEKKDETAEAWEGDKAEMIEAFGHGFMDSREPIKIGDGGSFRVKANCAFVEPGFYAYVASSPATIRVRARVLDPQGQLVDEIEIKTESANMAKRTRLRNAAEAAGAALAKYLKSRVAP